jgi:hypothetical protein
MCEYRQCEGGDFANYPGNLTASPPALDDVLPGQQGFAIRAAQIFRPVP